MSALDWIALTLTFTIGLLGYLALLAAQRTRYLKHLLRSDVLAGGVTVVVTARNEAADLESTVRRFREQKIANSALVVVDDRSTDESPAILARMASETVAGVPLQTRRIDHLPPGILGKVHACSVGAATAQTPWILFADGDVELADVTVLARIVGYAEAEGLDHLAVLPDTRPMGFWQETLMNVFAQSFLLSCRTYEQDRDLPRGGGGVGAFNLVRREAYERIGGHRELALEIGDDWRLGTLLKESGAKQRMRFGHDLVRCPWHRSARALIKGLEKNLFAGFGFSMGKVTLGALWFLALGFLPSLLSGMGIAHQRWWWGLPLFLQILAATSGWWLHRTASGVRLLPILAYPLGVGLFLVALANSTAKTLTRGGVRWRDTFYPLPALRAARVRTGQGRRFNRVSP